jgi:hypothetical protein
MKSMSSFANGAYQALVSSVVSEGSTFHNPRPVVDLRGLNKIVVKDSYHSRCKRIDPADFVGRASSAY